MYHYEFKYTNINIFHEYLPINQSSWDGLYETIILTINMTMLNEQLSKV